MLSCDLVISYFISSLYWLVTQLKQTIKEKPHNFCRTLQHSYKEQCVLTPDKNCSGLSWGTGDRRQISAVTELLHIECTCKMTVHGDLLEQLLSKTMFWRVWQHRCWWSEPMLSLQHCVESTINVNHLTCQRFCGWSMYSRYTANCLQMITVILESIQYPKTKISRSLNLLIQPKGTLVIKYNFVALLTSFNHI